MNLLKEKLIDFIAYLKVLRVLVVGTFVCSKKAFWFSDANNFGDVLTPHLFNFLGVNKLVKIDTQYYAFENYITIGSILSKANERSIVWGTGFISEDSYFKNGKPKKVCAVRGPKTRKKLLEFGVKCPEVYGDPALLLPRFYEPKKESKKYKLGIIPHYIDKDNEWLGLIKREDVLIIDIQNKNIFEFIDQVNRCEKIISSSLHGIIVGDAYGIPSLWVEFSQKIMGKGFKFLDYFQSVGRKDKVAIMIDESISIKYLLNCFYHYEIQIDLTKLIESCPFRNNTP